MRPTEGFYNRHRLHSSRGSRIVTLVAGVSSSWDSLLPELCEVGGGG